MQTLTKKLQKISIISAVIVCMFAGAVLALPNQNTGPAGGGATPTATSTSDPCHPENDTPPGTKLSADELRSCKDCNLKSHPTDSQLQKCLHNNVIVKDLNIIINFLSAGAAVVIVGSIIVGGIQYSIAGNNPSAVGAAKKRILDALIALLVFFFIFAFLQWLIPGGLLFR